MSEAKGFIKNISSNYFIFALRVVLGIYALPVCLHAFGIELYGLYIISFTDIQKQHYSVGKFIKIN